MADGESGRRGDGGPFLRQQFFCLPVSPSPRLPIPPSFLLVFCVVGLLSFSQGAEYPRGFFVEDLRSNPPHPAFFNLETHHLERFVFRQTYEQFIDVQWDQSHGRLYFSARRVRGEPFRLYLKTWPEGEEKSVYDSPKGPFRFVVSPDGDRAVLQVMGPSAWPFLGVLQWDGPHWTDLGQGFSPQWAVDSQSLLYLSIQGGLPTWLAEYTVDQDTATLIYPEPVTEAVYTDDHRQIILKTARQSKVRDVFQLWNRAKDSMAVFCDMENVSRKQKIYQREIAAFPGGQFFLFKEALDDWTPENQRLVVSDVWGRRLQTLAREDWYPRVDPVNETAFLMGEDPLELVQADGTGRPVEIPQARFIRIAQ